MMNADVGSLFEEDMMLARVRTELTGRRDRRGMMRL